MYCSYFGLQEAPFSISVNPRYLFMGARHRDALAHLLYGVGAGGGFILLTGEVGTGKTTINRCLLKQLPEGTDIAIVLNPALNAIELLATVCDELHIDYDKNDQSLKALTDKLHQFLLSNHSKNRNTVLLIDEAQHLSFDILEQIRLLTNLETDTKKLLQIILVGQPELSTLLAKPELRQLSQRITARYQLKPLNLHETHAYISHRLHVAGLPANPGIFPPNIVKQLHKISRGVPRLINILCDRMLLGAYGQNKTVVDNNILKQATAEVLGENENLVISSSPKLGMIAAALVVIMIGSIAWWQWSNSTPQTIPDTATTIESDTDTQTEQQGESGAGSSALITETKLHLHPWSKNQQLALFELLDLHSVTYANESDFCNKNRVGTVENEGSAILLCEQQTVETWQDFITYNRPAVLTLITPSKQRVYTTLIAIEDDNALVRHNKGTYSQLSLEHLGEMWTGEFLFLWHASPYYTKPIGLNDNTPMVKWLASQFAEIDRQPTLLADKVFNNALTQRVKIFQNEHNLDSDGWVGLKTLLKINDVLNISKTLATTIDVKYTQSQTPETQKSIQDYSHPREG